LAFLIQPFAERLFYIESLQGLSESYFFQGLGIGQFVFTMQQFFDEKLLVWQFQPIHNVFLLIFSEVGIVGLGLFLWFFIYVFLKNYQNVPRGTFETKTKMFHVEQF
jgi:O-antigen ligase